MTLRRTTAGDLDAVVSLQHAAYAKNHPLRGVEPLQLQVGCCSGNVAPPSGVGRIMLQWAEERARTLGRITMRLHADTWLTVRVAWYARDGYAGERIEEMPDRSLTHTVKRLAPRVGARA